MPSTCIDNWQIVIGLHVSDELLKLAEEGFGQYIYKTEMENDKILEQHKCFSAFARVFHKCPLYTTRFVL